MEVSSGDESDHRRFEDYSVSAGVSKTGSCGDAPLIGARFSSGKVEKETLTEMEVMKDRFSKLLLGEDMSGRGNGVCTALAISNAITRLSGSVFGDLWKLEALTTEKKSTWKREMDWLLSISDSIVELTPSFQEFPNGTFEVMVTRPRSDLYINLPPLKKLDAMLVTMLDGFDAESAEFSYIDQCPLVNQQYEHPFPKVPAKGLTQNTVRRLQQCRECSHHIFRAAAGINAKVLAQMEVPKPYLESLPKNAKACLGETLHEYIRNAHFAPESLLDYLEMSSECTTLEIANRMEAAAHIWAQRCSTGKNVLWSTNKEKSKLLSERANTLLNNLKLQSPALPQTTLDLHKIHSNKDVGLGILESYSRVIESLAFNLMARIDDLLYVDDATKKQGSSLQLRPSTTNVDPLQEALERLTFN